MQTVTLREQVEELERELKMRDALYPGFVRRKVLTADMAILQKTRLRAAIMTLRAFEQQENAEEPDPDT